MAANLLCFSAAAADATLHQSFPFLSSSLLTHSLLFSLLFSQRPLHGCFTVGFLLFFLEIAVKNNKAPREFLALPSPAPSPSLSRCLPSFFRFLSTCLVFFKFCSPSPSVAVELFLLFVLVMARPPAHPLALLALDFPARIEIETPRSAIVFICPAKWHNRSSPAPFACLPLPPTSRSQLTGSFVVPRFSTRCQLQKEQTNKQNYVHKRNPHLAYYSRHAPQKGPHK